MTDEQLLRALITATEIERAVRVRLDTTPNSPSEQARGQEAYRNVIGLRKALEKWIGTRKFRAAHPEIDREVFEARAASR